MNVENGRINYYIYRDYITADLWLPATEEGMAFIKELAAKFGYQNGALGYTVVGEDLEKGFKGE
jgi:hypothetical protein